jgi:hypothetical protein
LLYTNSMAQQPTGGRHTVIPHANVDTITWNEFKARFRTHYVPRGTMKLKRKEFTNLKQGGMTVNEYLNSFIQLSRYAPDNINTDEKK